MKIKNNSNKSLKKRKISKKKGQKTQKMGIFIGFLIIFVISLFIFRKIKFLIFSLLGVILLMFLGVF